MSSQLTSPPVHPEPAPKPRRIELSASQVIGGALAAMTAAALGSRLGVAGTIIGAALASIVAAVGGSLYTASIRASRERVRTVLVRRPATSARTDAAAPPTTETAQLVAAATDVPLPGSTTGPESTASGSTRKRPISWKTAGVGALAAFALAAAAVTGLEAVTGNALSGGSGTTITQVRQDASGGGGGSTTDTEPSTTPSASTSAEPSESASATTPSADPSASASADESSTAEPTPSASTSAEPTPSASATPSTTPSATASPTGAAGTTESTPTTAAVPAG